MSGFSTGGLPNTTPKTNTSPKTTENAVNSGSVSENSVSVSRMNDAVSNPVGDKTSEKYSKMFQAETFDDKRNNIFGVPSAFNRFAIFTHPRSNRSNSISDFHISENGVFTNKDNKILTIESLLAEFDPKKHQTDPLFAFDFMMCKYYKKIPLNRLIVLRRYSFPTFDNLTFSTELKKEFPPIAQAVTYFGDPTDNKLKEILKLNGKINWKDLTADVWQIDGNEQGFSANPNSGLINQNTGVTGELFKAVNILGGHGGDQNAKEYRAQQYRKKIEGDGDGFDWSNKRFGPVNVINKMTVRDRGLESNFSFDVKFHYQLRSYNNINPRMLLLDVIFNFLSLVYNNAKFWGGANRYFPNIHQNEFFGGEDAAKAYYNGDYGSYVNQVQKTLSAGFGNIGDKLSNLISGLFSGDVSSLSGILKSVGKHFLDVQSASSRPQTVAFHALLSGLPTGEWHLTVGNPFHPIARIGNLLVDEWTMEFNEELGYDDFPTEVTFTVKLKSGRPRDKGDLESILVDGGGRSYSPPKDFADILNLSSTTSADGNPITGGQSNTSQNSRSESIKNELHEDQKKNINTIIQGLGGSVF